MVNKSIARVLIILILIHNIGCYTYSQIEKDDMIEIEKDDEIKITTLNGKVYKLTDVEIQGSVLKGHRLEFMFRKDFGFDLEEISIPTEQIEKIEVDKFNPAITVLAVVLIIGIPLAAIANGVVNASTKGSQ